MQRRTDSKRSGGVSGAQLDPACRPGGRSDHLAAAARRANMQAVRRVGTAPELQLQRALRAVGLRFACNTLVGNTTPDVAFRRAKLAVFIDGCWWHGCPVHYRPPKHNRSYWLSKVQRNRARDRRNDRDLRRQGWLPLRLWSCELGDIDGTARRIKRRVVTRLRTVR
jgi:DNA mismatch endonuclease, patch repair protein